MTASNPLKRALPAGCSPTSIACSRSASASTRAMPSVPPRFDPRVIKTRMLPRTARAGPARPAPGMRSAPTAQ
jgi:hypothetical protein